MLQKYAYLKKEFESKKNSRVLTMKELYYATYRKGELSHLLLQKMRLQWVLLKGIVVWVINKLLRSIDKFQITLSYLT